MVKTVEKVVPPPEPEAEEAAGEKEPTSPGDVFSRVNDYRLRQRFDKLTTKKLLTTVAIRKPKSHEWFQAHPKYRLEWPLFKAQEEGLSSDWYFPATDEVLAVLEELSPTGVKNCRLYWWINRKANTFIWPVELANADGRHNDWHASMLDVMSVRAQGQWVRIEAGDGGYEVTVADPTDNTDAPQPDWPPVERFGDVLRVAFKKGGRVVEVLDHPLIVRLRG
jgi:hypothetical protein